MEVHASEVAELRRRLVEARALFDEASDRLYRKAARRQEERANVARLINTGLVKLRTVEIKLDALDELTP